MRSILEENVITIQQACDRLPRRRLGRCTHPSTAIRWILRGLGGVKLEAVKIGGTWLTSEQALSRFLVAVAKPKGESATTAAPSAVIDSKLAAAGLIQHGAKKERTNDDA